MGEFSHLEWVKVSSRAGPDLIVFRSRFDTVQHPKTGKAFERLVLETPPWCTIVPLTAERNVVLTRQFRFGVSQVTMEIPGGAVDQGETSLEAAQRELWEETGYASAKWSYLGYSFQNPAFHDNLCHHWLAEDVVQTVTPAQEDGEYIETESLTVSEVQQAVRDGSIRHPQGIVALSRVFDLRVRCLDD